MDIYFCFGAILNTKILLWVFVYLFLCKYMFYFFYYILILLIFIYFISFSLFLLCKYMFYLFYKEESEKACLKLNILLQDLTGHAAQEQTNRGTRLAQHHLASQQQSQDGPQPVPPGQGIHHTTRGLVRPSPTQRPDAPQPRCSLGPRHSSGGWPTVTGHRGGLTPTSRGLSLWTPKQHNWDKVNKRQIKPTFYKKKKKKPTFKKQRPWHPVPSLYGK